jgi:hypothetical protein
MMGGASHRVGLTIENERGTESRHRLWLTTLQNREPPAAN